MLDKLFKIFKKQKTTDTKFAGVLVAEILSINKHPNADRLNIAEVNTGKDKLIIVCGAPNITVGQKVPCAVVGAKLANGLEIKAASIRGQESHGMLCAADELGLNADHSGILILPSVAKLGDNIDNYIK